MRYRPVFVAAAAIYFVLAAAGATAAIAAEVQALPLGAERSTLELVTENRAELIFQVTFGGLTAEKIAADQGAFTRLRADGAYTSRRIGAPELPQLNRLIAIPTGAVATVEILASRSRVVDLVALGLGDPIWPAQPSREKREDAEPPPFAYDPVAYSAGKARVETARLVPLGRLRSLDLGRLEISPVTYDPAQNRLDIFESMTVRIAFEGADHDAARELIARTHSPFFEPVYAAVANAKGYHDDYPDLVSDLVTMVVITPPQYETQIQPLLDWKTERGFYVIEGVVGSPEVGVTAESIQTYIHGLYNSPPTGYPAPSFVLFVGDVEQVPTFSIEYHATDRPYCAVDGDYLPDIYYGRLSAGTPTELQAILDKTLMYDRFTMPDPSYLGEVCLIAGVDGTYGPVWGNGQIYYGANEYFNLAHGITSHSYWHPDSGSQRPAILSDVSNGVALVNYTGHGSVYSWSNPGFTQPDVRGLENENEYCLAIGNGCSTSPFTNPECFGETWLRVPKKGAIGYIGASASTYWDEDYWWAIGHTAEFLAEPVYADAEFGAYDGLFHDHGEAENLWYVTNDAIIYCGNLAVTESGSVLWDYYWDVYNLLGDPSLSVYLGVPGVNVVAHPDSVTTDATSLTLQAEPGSYVGLSQDAVLVGAGTVPPSGELTIGFLQPSLVPQIPLRLVVTRQNREPYVVDLAVMTSADVVVAPLSVTVDTPTEVTVTVTRDGGATPWSGLEVWLDGLGYRTSPVVTDAAGQAVVTATAPYGPAVDVVVQDPAESYELHRQAIAVGASSLVGADLSVSTEVGVIDAFVVGYPGSLDATVPAPAHTLFAELPDGTVLETTETSLTLVPESLGTVTGTIAVRGYDLYSESFAVGDLDANGILVLDDDGGAAKAGASDLVTGLILLDYEVTTRDASEPLPATWTQYDLLIVACGDNSTPLADPALRAALVAYVNDGGRLLIEGGEVGRFHYQSDLEFAQDVLHIADWVADLGDALVVFDPAHPVMSTPHTISVIGLADTPVAADQDAVLPAGDAVRPAMWAVQTDAAAIVAYDSFPQTPASGHVVYFPFDYAILNVATRWQLLENSVSWLLTPELGTGGVSGRVTLHGQSDHAGVTVTAEPGGFETTTAGDGSYSLSGMAAGRYHVYAASDGWATGVNEIALTAGQQLADVDFVLRAARNMQICRDPDRAIPDNSPAGIADDVSVGEAGQVSAVRVYLDITHPDGGDLVVSLTSPTGVNVVLHDRGGSGTGNLQGWYPEELSSYGSLDAFSGEDMIGAWRLVVSDQEYQQIGSLASWCLELDFAEDVHSSGAGPVAATMIDGGVVLRWSYDPALVDGFHVDRRVAEGAVIRLTDMPLSSPDGSIQFRDPGHGISAGATVGYRYVMLRNGQQVGHGAEVLLVFGGGLPAALALAPNYPNPFNPHTTLGFEVPRAGRVSLRIYDVGGRLVATLVDAVLPAGVHVRQWDGRNSRGKPMPSGAYFCRLTGTGGAAVRKLMLAK